MAADPTLRRDGRRELCGLRLVKPPGFLREIDELARGDRYRPVDLAGTEVTRREVGADGAAPPRGRFVNHRAGERLRTCVPTPSSPRLGRPTCAWRSSRSTTSRAA